MLYITLYHTNIFREYLNTLLNLVNSKAGVIAGEAKDDGGQLTKTGLSVGRRGRGGGRRGGGRGREGRCLMIISSFIMLPRALIVTLPLVPHNPVHTVGS